MPKLHIIFLSAVSVDLLLWGVTIGSLISRPSEVFWPHKTIMSQTWDVLFCKSSHILEYKMWSTLSRIEYLVSQTVMLKNENYVCPYSDVGNFYWYIFLSQGLTCLIEGQCYSNGQTHPTDPCLRCSTATSYNSWSLNPGNSANHSLLLSFPVFHT